MPEEETRQRILEAALQLFSERGYDGTATRAIAALAGVNEVTLFRHFGSKNSLFQAVLRHNSAIPDFESTLREQLTGDFRQDLLILAEQFLTMLYARRKEIIMLLAEAERRPEMLEMVAFVPLQQRQVVSNYLKGQMEQGNMRPLDPLLAAQGLLGMLFTYCLGQSLLPENLRWLPLDEVAASFVDLFVEGIRK
jgi:AcrR family transcriptional regulator